jgi:hypothetical protein
MQSAAIADGEISSSEKIIAAADTNIHTKAFGIRVSSSSSPKRQAEKSSLNKRMSPKGIQGVTSWQGEKYRRRTSHGTKHLDILTNIQLSGVIFYLHGK